MLTGYRSRTRSSGSGRNPGARGQIMSTMLLGQAVAETTGLYGLVVALLFTLRTSAWIILGLDIFVHFKGAAENPTERRVESVSRIFIFVQFGCPAAI